MSVERFLEVAMDIPMKRTANQLDLALLMFLSDQIFYNHETNICHNMLIPIQ